jgi:hypothetical protein
MTGAIITAVLAVAFVGLAFVAHERRQHDLYIMLALIGIVMAMVSCTRAGGVA